MADDAIKSPQEFQKFLKWLDLDHETAIEKYFSIRNKLVKIFVVRGSIIADELADETIDRVMKKIDTIVSDYQGDPSLYFYGVAKKVFLETQRQPKSETLPDSFIADQKTPENQEENVECVEKCLKKLPENQQQIIVGYYSFEKGEKSKTRKKMAEKFGFSAESLRVRAMRIRETLQKCVFSCIENI
jgi:RNA polymerase sigma factor (sigma-70 family)